MKYGQRHRRVIRCTTRVLCTSEKDTDTGRGAAPTSRNAICPRGGLRESAGESTCIYISPRTYIRMRGRLKFFRRPLEDQAPFIKCSLESEGAGGEARVAKISSNFSHPPFALVRETNGNEVDFRIP